jgi:hypothetical protein
VATALKRTTLAWAAANGFTEGPHLDPARQRRHARPEQAPGLERTLREHQDAGGAAGRLLTTSAGDRFGSHGPPTPTSDQAGDQVTRLNASARSSAMTVNRATVSPGRMPAHRSSVSARADGGRPAGPACDPANPAPDPAIRCSAPATTVTSRLAGRRVTASICPGAPGTGSGGDSLAHHRSFAYLLRHPQIPARGPRPAQSPVQRTRQSCASGVPS